jgi:mRNA interferase RelE/StbE
MKEVKIAPKAKKYLDSLKEPHKSRIKQAVEKLSNDAPQGDIKAMSGYNDYRLRVGDYRVLFEVEKDFIYVEEIGLRGQIYKRR